MGFYENFIRKCNMIGMTPCAVAMEAGLSKPAVTRWKNGSQPTDATVMRLDDYFREAVKARLQRIEDEENFLYDQQYRYGYIVDRQHMSKLYHEKQALRELLPAPTKVRVTRKRKGEGHDG